MKSKLEQAQKITKEYNQQQLLSFYEELSSDEKESLLDAILSIDFQLIDTLYKELVVERSHKIEGSISPLKSFDAKNCSDEKIKSFSNLGLKAIKSGKAAAFLVAGGLGSRLGHQGPKGTYRIGLPSGKALFQLQCERLLNLSRRAGRPIPWYIMTSPENHLETVSFFEENNYFGYNRDYVKFFQQGMLPMVDENGKIMLEQKHKISMGPNGNGGCFLALEYWGMLKDMKDKGVEWVFLYGIDNALVRPVDPEFLGFTIESGLNGASKVVAKKNAGERVGVLCYRDGRPAIVEYSEMPEEMAQERDIHGNLMYDNANILSHMLSLSFVEESLRLKIPYHAAYKKISYINEKGESVKPDSPNGYKFESFLFDMFAGLEDMAAYKVLREEEFAPVKNKEGEDSPETARNLIESLHKSWLKNWGIDESLLEGRFVEVSPLTSYAGEDINVKEVARKLQDTKGDIEI